MTDPTGWFLTESERGNPDTDVPFWRDGNVAEPLVHGRTYFEELAKEVEACRPGDYVFFTDWRGDPDELEDVNLARLVNAAGFFLPARLRRRLRKMAGR